MRSTRLAACVSVLVVFGACSSSSKSSQDGALGGTPDGARDVAAVGGSGGNTGTAGSTGAGGSVGGTSVGGGTGLGGTLSSTAAGGRGGSAGTTTGTASGGSTSGPDAGTVGTGGSPRLDGGASSGPDASTPIDTPVGSKPDGAEAGVDSSRAEASTDDGGASGFTFCRGISSGCQCSSVAAAGSNLSECNKESVRKVNPGRCCKASTYCSCESMACAADNSTGRCRCDYVDLIATLLSWTPETQCVPTSGLTCCLFASESYCQCKQQECPAGATQVSTCTPAQLNACPNGEQAVDSCR
jgi:hypothetical protein